MQFQVPGLEAFVEQKVEEAVARALGRGADEWLDSTQAADYLRISRPTLHDLVSAGKLPRRGERKTKLMFRRSDLDAYVEARGGSS